MPDVKNVILTEVTNPLYKKRKLGNTMATFCNFFVANTLCKITGRYDLFRRNGIIPYSANAMLNVLVEHSFFKQINLADVKQVVKNGGVVICGCKRDRHGHVAFVVDGDWEYSTTHKMRLPKVANVGSENSTRKLSWFFRSTDDIWYFECKMTNMPVDIDPVKYI